MRKIITFLAIFLALFSGKNTSVLNTPLFAAQFDYQNFNHGYCPTCDKCGCNPCSCCPTPSSETTDQLPQPTPPPASPCNTGCNTACDNPCAASVNGTQCGISICAIGIAVAAIAAAAAIIISSGNGHAHH